MNKTNVLNTDVLVIGGGFAGNFAAIKAAETGASVIMAVKGRTGRSGQTPWANSFFVFNETQGVTKEDYYKQFDLSGEYLCNKDYVEALIDESYDRYLDLSKWGAITGRENYYQTGTVTRSIEVVGSGDVLRKQALKVGVKLLERIMITTLIKPNDSIEGAVGFHMETGETYAIIAKATILCTGASSFKALGFGFPCCSVTGDGDAMAYRAGGEISGKEFNDGHPDRSANHFAKHEMRNVSGDAVTKKSPLELGGGPGGSVHPAKILHGDLIGMRIDTTATVHEKGLPLERDDFPMPGVGIPKGQGYKTHANNTIGSDFSPMHPHGGRPPRPPMNNHKQPPHHTPTGYSAVGMSNHKAEGLFPYDAFGKTNLKNLWAAGDSLSSMQNGAGYAGFGCSCAGSCVQGARSGIAAANAAKNMSTPKIDMNYIETIQAEMLSPITNEKGFSPAWVLQLMQNIMFPYYVMYYKEKTRMEAALSQIMYLQEQFAPRLSVNDFHGLRMAHECKNILLIAEMKLRSGLAREESRGTHIREDFPYRDDENFLCWIKLVEKDGKMITIKHPLPENFKPDSKLSYREKYPCEYPNEEKYITNKS